MSKRLQEFWLKQSIAEYNSSARTVNLVHWMQQAAFSPDLIIDAISIANDEMNHSCMCYEISQGLGNSGFIEQSSLSLHLPKYYNDIRKNILHVIVESFCFGETLAVPLFKEMRRNSTETKVLDVYKIILSDESRHASFGWTALAWCMEQWPSTSEWIEETVPVALKNIFNSYYTHDEYHPSLSKKEKQWGMMSKQEYSSVFRKTVKSTFEKRLAEYGISIIKIHEELEKEHYHSGLQAAV